MRDALCSDATFPARAFGPLESQRYRQSPVTQEVVVLLLQQLKTAGATAAVWTGVAA